MIRFLKVACLIILLGMSVMSCAQSQEKRIIFGRESAKEELKAALKEPLQPNVVFGKSLLLSDSILAVQVAEPILFRTYGKGHILNQRPYEIYLIDQYWVIKGTLRKEWDGGTFLLIMDARNSRIIRLIHGK